MAPAADPDRTHVVAVATAADSAARTTSAKVTFLARHSGCSHNCMCSCVCSCVCVLGQVQPAVIANTYCRTIDSEAEAC